MWTAGANRAGVTLCAVAAWCWFGIAMCMEVSIVWLGRLSAWGGA